MKFLLFPTTTTITILTLVWTAWLQMSTIATPIEYIIESSSLQQQQQQQPPRRNGIHNLLAVRVVYNFNNNNNNLIHEPKETIDEINDALFNINDDASVISQFNAISHEQIQFMNAGCIQIHVTLNNNDYDDNNNQNYDNYFIDIIWPKIQNTMNDKYPEWNNVDKVMFCLPNDSLPDGVWAMANLGGSYSFYHYQGCIMLMVVIHELGHNLGFLHSGKNNNTYGDYTGYMGGSGNAIMATPRYPRKAFNGHKHWISGWFDDRAVVIDITNNNKNLETNGSIQYIMKLISFVDYQKSSSDDDDDGVILIQIGPLYVQYNRAKDYNIDTWNPNTVTVTEALDGHKYTNALAALTINSTLSYRIKSSTTTSIIVVQMRICEITITTNPIIDEIDYATIGIQIIYDNIDNQNDHFRRNILQDNKKYYYIDDNNDHETLAFLCNNNNNNITSSSNNVSDHNNNGIIPKLSMTSNNKTNENNNNNNNKSNNTFLQTTTFLVLIIAVCCTTLILCGLLLLH